MMSQPRAQRLVRRAADARLLGNVSLPALLRLPSGVRGPHMVTTDPGTGRIALGGHRLWILDPRGTRVLGSCRSPGPIMGGTWIRGDRIAAELGPEAGLPHRLGVFRVPDSAPPSPFLDLFAACLAHRFGNDVGIGRSAPEVGDDEIGISRAIGGRG
jgi:hypothetical protein